MFEPPVDFALWCVLPCALCSPAQAGATGAMARAAPVARRSAETHPCTPTHHHGPLPLDTHPDRRDGFDGDNLGGGIPVHKAAHDMRPLHCSGQVSPPARWRM